MDIDTGDHPPIAKKPYILPLKQSQWVCEKFDMSEKAEIISRHVSPQSSSIVIVPKKAQPGELPKKHLCVDYHTLDNL